MVFNATFNNISVVLWAVSFIGGVHGGICSPYLNFSFMVF